jgi:hypothetical protein
MDMRNDIPAPEHLETDTVVRLREAITAGLRNGKQLKSLRQIEASIDRLAEGIDAAVHADEPEALDQGLNLVLTAQRRELQIPDGEEAGPRLLELAGAWQANTLPDDQRRLFERNTIAANIQSVLRVTHTELTLAPQQPQPILRDAEIEQSKHARPATLRRIEASIDRLAEAMDMAVHADEPAVLDECLNLVLIAQRRELQVPDGEGAGRRFQELAAAWQAHTLPDDQRRLFERNMIAANGEASGIPPRPPRKPGRCRFTEASRPWAMRVVGSPSTATR